MAEEKKKKDRSANFTIAEIDLLCDLVTKKCQKIECKKTDALTWKEKEQEWIHLTNEFNNRNDGVPRTLKSLRTKYETLKKELRKKAAGHKIELFKTGGGTCSIQYTPMEEKLLNIISLSVEGLPSRYDDDVSNIPNGSNVEVDTVGSFEDHDYTNNTTVIYLNQKELDCMPVTEHHTVLTDTTNTQIDKPQNEPFEGCTQRDSLTEKYPENISHSWSTWNPAQLRRPVSKPLQGNRTRKLSKPEASEKIVMVASSKQKLLDLQYEALLLDMEFKKKYNELQLRKGEVELNNAVLEGEIKQLDKQIKAETLNKMSRVLSHQY